MKNQAQNFNKSDLAIHLSRRFPSLSDEIIIEAMDLILQEIINAVALDNRVEIRGFGSFSKKNIRPRRFINPKTKEKHEKSCKYDPKNISALVRRRKRWTAVFCE